MVRQADWFATVAITTQVTGNDGVMLGQLAGDLVPDHMGLRMAMQQ